MAQPWKNIYILTDTFCFVVIEIKIGDNIMLLEQFRFAIIVSHFITINNNNLSTVYSAFKIIIH